MLEIALKKCSFDEIINDVKFKDIAEEYEAEAKNSILPPVHLNVPMYKKMEELGFMYIYGAFYDTELIGFAWGFVTINPKYSVKMTTSESLFVTKKHRNTKAGLKLVDLIEEQISVGTVISAPKGSQLEALLPLKGYIPIDTIFYKKTINE